ncbi:MAG: sulfite exporter TauE/SafE family protein [Elusimicrobiota bacterium]|jgi:sulfite exporter TauE/SafE/copper chaperone CopZ|nr:sulfite exporter TauE/SafE family protein [Elusimicrobiota bacterium]
MIENLRLHIDNMTCVNCQNKIERKLKETQGIKKAGVSFNLASCDIDYDSSIISADTLKKLITELGYSVSGVDESGKGQGSGIKTALKAVVGFVLLFVFLGHLSKMPIFNFFPTAQAEMRIGALFLIGLITSFHCVFMCGGINLSQCLPLKNQSSAPKKLSTLKPSLLYNLGRVFSYTLVGGVLGGIGSFVAFDEQIKGIIQIAAGIFMIAMALNMMGAFVFLRKFIPKAPSFVLKKLNSSKLPKTPLIVGILNGLMPCGPLQAMQLYAFSTGSVFFGALSMFVFSAGTVPLMFIFGTAASFLSKKWTDKVMKIGAVIIAALGLSMISYGINTAGLRNFMASAPSFSQSKYSKSEIEGGVQVVRSELLPGKYPSIAVEEGVPVRWIIEAAPENINGCNYKMSIKEYGIKHTWKPGTNVIEFTPQKAGRFFYSCWMGMISGEISVFSKEEFGGLEAAALTDVSDLSPEPAYFLIPYGDSDIKIAQKKNDIQSAEIEITDEGISPAVIIVEKGIELNLIINNKSSSEANKNLLFNLYRTKLDLKRGKNEVKVFPMESFDFSNANNSAYGYIKAVEDIKFFDIEDVKKEVSSHETLIYPIGFYSVK